MTDFPSVTKRPLVFSVLLNWNGWADTISCLDALSRGTYTPLIPIVVDNGSSDDSVLKIRASHPNVLVLEAGANLGFAGGNNIGIRYAMSQGADYIWLLNNDTEPAPNALDALVARILRNKEIGAVSSVCYYADAPSKVQVWGGTRVNLWIGYTRNSTTAQKDEWFDALYGASLLISARALEDVGLLDAGFFFYWEETEFCLRLRRKGWRLAAAPDSRVVHKVSVSAGNNMLVRDRYFTASGLRILRLHSPMPSLAMFLFLAIRLARRLLRLEFSHCRSVLSGIGDYRARLSMGSD